MNMKNSIQKIYQDHHLNNRPQNFSILEKERGDLLKKYIGKGKKIIDIGCRDGTLTKHFIDDNDILGVDIDIKALHEAEMNFGIKTIHMDLNGDWNELGDKKFDVVVAGEVLEHLYYPEKILKSILRHMNSEGIFIGSVPNAFSLKNRIRYLFGSKKWTPLSDPTHINQFSYGELNDILKKQFNDVKIIGLGRYRKLSKIFPSLFAFDLFWISKNKKE